MAGRLQTILATPDDSKLCGDLYVALSRFHGENIDVSTLGEVERVVLLVYDALGIIGNGGFRGLLECRFAGDPAFAQTMTAFRAVGCPSATLALEKTLALFPHSRPHSQIKERLRHYLSRISRWPTDEDQLFFDSMEDLGRCLATYIRSHAQGFSHLDRAEHEVAEAYQLREPAPHATPILPTGPRVTDLPHWACVAYAARCARHVLPLLRQYWADIPSDREHAVLNAIDLTQQSVLRGRPMAGLKSAVLDATISAGAALCAQSADAGPADAWAGTVASLVAKVAEKATESARTEGTESRQAANEAWAFALDVAEATDDDALAAAIDDDLTLIAAAANRLNWTEQTPVPPTIWATPGR